MAGWLAAFQMSDNSSSFSKPLGDVNILELFFFGKKPDSSLFSCDPLGDGKSLLELIHVAPNNVTNLDSFICNAARVSFANDNKIQKDDRALIRYLLRKQHTSPFEMVEFYFVIKCPIFIARQWIRHRTASVNEESGRYIIYRPEFYIPNDKEEIKKQSKNNKQGRSDESVDDGVAEEYINYITESYKETYEKYVYFTEKGIAKEIARNMLPLAQYTRFMWKMDLHNLLNFIRLRTAPDAMLEIRKYAEAIQKVLKPLLPHTMEAFEDFQQKSLTLTRLELKSIADSKELSNATSREEVEWKEKKSLLEPKKN